MTPSSSLRLILLSLLATCVGLPGCDRKSNKDSPDAAPAPPAATSRPVTAPSAAPTRPAASAPATNSNAPKTLFTEITAQAGFDENPKPYPNGTYQTPEITPGGVALVDIDNDGRLDILLIRHPAPGPDAFTQTLPNRLFKQTAAGTFIEVPDAGGLGGSGYHNSAAVGDIDNDGFPEIYLTNYGSANQLFHNNGDGTFTDITEKAGLKPATPPLLNWTSTAAFVDYDGDGFLDLVVVHFATFNPTKICQTSTDPTDRDYCGPHMFPGQLITLYHNNGNGTFSDVTRELGLDTPGRGWGIIAAPLASDDRADILQANDEEPNQLWVRQADGKFLDEAVFRGLAYNADGHAQANMGVTVGDLFNRGALDVYITHITTETSALFKNDGSGSFIDIIAQSGIDYRAYTGWGCGLFDFDNDGNLDLAVANGRVAKGPPRDDSKVGPFWSRYAEPNLLFRGDGAGRFTDVSAAAGAFSHRPEVHRAIAFADLFNRGRIDMVTMNLDNTVRLFRNDAAPASNHWLQVLPLLGKREALGAKVFLTAGGKRRAALCLRAYSYNASNDPRIHFGLGTTTSAESLEIFWPSGNPRKELFAVPGVDRVLTIRQGEGKAE